MNENTRNDTTGNDPSADPLAGSLVDLIEHGRPLDLPVPADAEPMVSTSIRLPLALLEWAKGEAETRGLPSWSALVRQLLEAEQDTAVGAPVVSVERLQQLINQIARRSSAA